MNQDRMLAAHPLSILALQTAEFPMLLPPYVSASVLMISR
jgi:hypothetical protein